MFNPAKIALEIALLVATFAIFRLAAGTRRRRFILGFTAVTVVLNLAFYYLAAWPLYVSYGQASGLDRSALHTQHRDPAARTVLMRTRVEPARPAAERQHVGRARGSAYPCPRRSHCGLSA